MMRNFNGLLISEPLYKWYMAWQLH